MSPDRSRGYGLIAALMLLLASSGAWQASQRTVRLDRAGPASIARWPDMRIDLNRAAAAELSVLPGIGPRLAERIVEDRDRHGPFTSLSDLRRVRGIGPAIVDRISPYAFIADPPPAP